MINVFGRRSTRTEKVIEEQIAPYLIKMIDNTRGGSEKSEFLEALRLRETGAF